MAGSLALRELSDATVSGITLAGRGDDTELRALLRQAVIPGAVRVAFTREPDYFAGEGLAGSDDFTLVARREGLLVAMGRCSVHSLWSNGRVQRLGYLGELRVAPGAAASPAMLRDGYAFLAEVASTASAEQFFTSIAADNARARRVLEHGGRLGLPAYRALADLVTLVAPVVRPQRDAAASRHASYHALCRDEEREALTAFLQASAPQAHLTLSWDATRWEALARHGITPDSFSVVRNGGAIVAAAAIWNQRAFRQTVIDGYEGALRLARPLLNAVRAARGLPILPAAGRVLSQAALLAATVNEAHDWPPLWHALKSRAAAMGVSWLSIARDARDPHLPLLRRLLRAREYRTTLYEVAWRDRPSRGDAWDARVFRPEVGLL